MRNFIQTNFFSRLRLNRNSLAENVFAPLSINSRSMIIVLLEYPTRAINSMISKMVHNEMFPFLYGKREIGFTLLINKYISGGGAGAYLWLFDANRTHACVGTRSRVPTSLSTCERREFSDVLEIMYIGKREREREKKGASSIYNAGFLFLIYYA